MFNKCHQYWRDLFENLNYGTNSTQETTEETHKWKENQLKCDP